MTIKDIRTYTDRTQKEFSEETGIPLRTIEDWEAGRRKPPQYIVNMLHYIFITKNGTEWDKDLFE